MEQFDAKLLRRKVARRAIKLGVDRCRLRQVLATCRVQSLWLLVETSPTEQEFLWAFE